MQTSLNGQDKKVITQYINDTLSKYEIFQKEKSEHSKLYEEKIMNLNIELSQEKQKSQLLEQELNQVKQRLEYLKKQDSIFSLIKGQTEQKMSQHESSFKLKINDMSSIIQFDEQKIKQIQFQRNKFKRMYQESEAHCQRLKQQNQQYQKQITILTQYINQKQIKTNQRIQKLEFELSGVNDKQIQQDKQTIRNLQKEKKVLESNIEKCTNVVKQLQEYYTEQIRLLQNQLRQNNTKKNQSYMEESKRQLNALQQSLKSALKSKVQVDKVNATLTRQLEEIKRDIEVDLNQISKKRHDQKQQFQLSQKLLIETFEKKVEIMQQQFKQIELQYRDKIKFLIIKLDETNHPMTEFKKQPSKFKFDHGFNFQDISVCQSQSISYRVQDSLRFDSTSVARSIKQNLMKPNKKYQISAHKDFLDITPVKSSNSHNVLSERTNIR